MTVFFRVGEPSCDSSRIDPTEYCSRGPSVFLLKPSQKRDQSKTFLLCVHTLLCNNYLFICFVCMYMFAYCICMWAQVPQYTHGCEDNLCQLVLYYLGNPRGQTLVMRLDGNTLSAYISLLLLFIYT